MDDLAGKLAAVRDRIERAGGDTERITLVAVTKGFDASAVRAALAAGVRDVGESYVQELTAKVAALQAEGLGAEGSGADAGAAGPAPVWHFVGRLQRNKVRKAAPHVALWHSVDRLALGAEIARWAPGAAVLAQVNTTGEETKGGCPPTGVGDLVAGLRELGLDVRGLMTIGPPGPPEGARPAFQLLRELAETHGLKELSMGMTGDLEVAVEEGATIVRVGTALFGPRPVRPGMRH
ncbi:MAG TPA: YggS family pyridoxal phosphate-dependent enzyme [Acidimicrobiales bacterium]